MSSFTILEVINKLLSDNDNMSKDKKRELENSSVIDEDITSESDKDYQLEVSIKHSIQMKKVILQKMGYSSYPEIFANFQPFKNSQFNTGVIYVIIYNLSRDKRFKSVNILTLAMIPSSIKLKLHQPNHYLAPLVDQLIELRQDIELETFEYLMEK
ncbi:hypothetical protein RhiirC2_780026 [Rhizophagus irregularis]|uniref:Uncharacterized protein n=2 Tax=Rhizophagus irregularis TaxID=588596 RepID=A0A2N1N8J3_9GLOM|nr:hypothetical protein RhiirC2_780026 [Rhizophagus irregularis]